MEQWIIFFWQNYFITYSSTERSFTIHAPKTLPYGTKNTTKCHKLTSTGRNFSTGTKKTAVFSHWLTAWKICVQSRNFHFCTSMISTQARGVILFSHQQFHASRSYAFLASEWQWILLYNLWCASKGIFWYQCLIFKMLIHLWAHISVQKKLRILDKKVQNPCIIP